MLISPSINKFKLTIIVVIIIIGEGSYKDHLKAAGLSTLFERRLLLCEAFYKKMNKPA